MSSFGFPQPNDAWVAQRRDALAGEFRRERRRRRAARAAAAGLILALAATGGLVGVLGTGGPQSAYAGWTAIPKGPTPAELRAAEGPRSCNVGIAPTAIGPTVAEARGPFLMLVFERAGRQELCITRPGVWTTIARGPLPPKLAPDTVTNLGAGFGHLGFGPLISFVAANTGAAVTGVSLTLHDGQRVTATVAHGWAIAWWPGASYEASATVSVGRRTFSFPIAPPRWLQNCSLLRVLHLHFPCQRRT